ncbi:MAG TPA: hypothetical protein VFV34_20930 [Blastocatellia bacterium]|nr:hypothetical protein [Blastocatellia bacterium]
MKKTALVLSVTSIFLFGILQATSAQKGKGRNVTMSTGSHKEITDCDQLRMRIGDGETARSELMQTIPRSAVSLLRVRPPMNGGVQIHGSNANEYVVKACLAAGGDDLAQAQELLKDLRLSTENGEVSVEGPNSKEWVAFLVIQAPNGSNLDLTAANGPIGVSRFSGTVKVLGVNGPVTLDEVSGSAEVEVQNGPLTVRGGGGDFRLNAQNGPLTVALAGYEWSGSLEGHTQNGPLTLQIPENYVSAVLVDTSKHSPVTCRAGQCAQAVRTWDNPNRIQFGGSNPVVRLSTVNGPVTIVSAANN